MYIHEIKQKVDLYKKKRKKERRRNNYCMYIRLHKNICLTWLRSKMKRSFNIHVTLITYLLIMK